MPLPIIAAVIIGAGAGVVSGFVIDHVIGDGNYTRRELAVDATTGALGLGVLKAGAKVVGGLHYANLGRKLDKAEDAAGAIKAGFAAARQGVAEIYAIKGVNLAVASLDSGTAIQDAKSSITNLGAVEPISSGSTKSNLPRNGRGRRANMRKTWCRRHRQYDLCR